MLGIEMTRQDRRIRLCLSRRELARILQVDPLTLYRWETGRNQPGRLQFAEWGRILGELERGNRKETVR